MAKAEQQKKTIAQMDRTVGYLDRDGIGYRKTRATAVLAMSSHYISKMQDKKLNRVLARLRGFNFDLARLSARDLELIYAYFDEKMTDAICAEFSFQWGHGNIRDLRSCSGYCDLCGKGDSLETGENIDKLRYQFKLTNHAGGTDLWVGSSCIWQHGLHVDGAANAEEAKERLRKSLQEHIKQWKIEAWREEHPDHETIPAFRDAFRRIHFKSYPPDFWAAVGFNDVWKLINEWRSHERPFRSAAKFYAKKGFLSPKKTEAWEEAKAFFDSINYFDWFREAMEVSKISGSWWKSDYSKGVELLERKMEAREAERREKRAARKARRKPNHGKKRTRKAS